MTDRQMMAATPLILRPPSGLVNKDRIVWSAATQRQRKVAAWIACGGLCVWVALQLLRPDPSRAWTLWLAIGVLLLLFAWGLLLSKRVTKHAHISVDNDNIQRQGAFGSPTVISRSSVVRLHRCLVAVGGGSSAPYLLLLDAQDRCVMRLLAQTWGPANIEALRSALNLPIDGSWDSGAPLSYRKLRKQFPGSCQWWQAHMIALTLITTLVAFAVFVVIYAVATGGR